MKMTTLALSMSLTLALGGCTGAAPDAEDFTSTTSAVTGSVRWAVILCARQGSSYMPPSDVGAAQDLLTRSGTGGVVDYFATQSYGHLDVGGSQFFGWIVTPDIGAWEDGVAPTRTLASCRAATGVDLSSFAHTLVVGNMPSWSDGHDVILNRADWTVPVAAERMMFTMGLPLQSMQDPDLGFDPFDLMSADKSSWPLALGVAPDLNVGFRNDLGWVDPTRVHVYGQAFNNANLYAENIDVAAADHPEAPGSLLIKVPTSFGRYELELRRADHWTQNLAADVVLLHKRYFGSANSFYVGTLPTSSSYVDASENLNMHVVSFDPAHALATVNVRLDHATSAPVTKTGNTGCQKNAKGKLICFTTSD